MERLECENMQLRQATEGALESASIVLELDTSSTHVERLLEALEPHSVGLEMRFLQSSGARCGNEVSEL